MSNENTQPFRIIQKISEIFRVTYYSIRNPALFWEMLLLEIRQKSVYRASILKINRNKVIDDLEKELKILGDNGLGNTEELIIKTEEHENLRSKILEGVLIRSKARWIGEGGKIIKILLQLRNKTLHILENDKLN